MSSAFAQRSAGIVGVRGAPRPTLVNAAGDRSAGEHESDVTTISAPRTACVLFNSCIWDTPAFQMNAMEPRSSEDTKRHEMFCHRVTEPQRRSTRNGLQGRPVSGTTTL